MNNDYTQRICYIIYDIYFPGGITTVYVGQPLDTVKVKMQTFPEMYKGGFDCLVNTFKKDGIYRGLYAGTVPALAANISENAVLFLFYGVCQKLVSVGGMRIQQMGCMIYHYQIT